MIGNYVMITLMRFIGISGWGDLLVWRQNTKGKYQGLDW